MDNICNFFLGSNPDNPEAKGRISLATLQKTLEAFEYVCNEAFYVVDMKQLTLFYMSRKLAAYLARHGNAVYGSSLEQFFHCIPDTDAVNYRDYGPLFRSLFGRVPVSERYSLVLSGHHRLATDRGYRMICELVAPLAEDADGNLRLTLCTLRSSSAKQAGGVRITKGHGEARQVFLIEEQRWADEETEELSDEELEVLTLAGRGFTTEEIADRAILSPDSVKRRKKSIFKKLGVDSIAQAILKARNHGKL